MEPQEKAKQILNKFWNKFDLFNEEAKVCALVSVDEIIIQWEYIDTYLSDLGGELNPNLKYWYKVKKELESL